MPSGALGQRYYLCTETTLLARLPSRVHADLVEKRLAVPLFANTDQCILEITLRDGQPLRSSARGCIYHFDSDGFFDLHLVVEAMTHIVRKPVEKSGSVIRITGLLARRRWAERSIWKPAESQVNAAIEDIGGTARVPVWLRSQCVKVVP